MTQVIPLVAIELIMIRDVIVRGEQEPARARSGIANGLTGLRTHDIHNRLDERTRREVLTGSALGILGVLFQQTFVNLPFDVDVQPDSGFAVDQFNQAAELGGVLDLVLRFAEDDEDQPAP